VSDDFPTIITRAGLTPQTPAAILAALIARVMTTNPGYTANLPGSLVEDISSTDVGAVALCDAAMVELVNSLTPHGANAFLLNQLGQVYGVQLGLPSRTSVNVVFSGPPGFVIPKGFTVTDGTYQYVVQVGGIIATGGDTAALFALATQDGSWSVPTGTVTEVITSVPSSVTPTVTVNNPTAGLPASSAESEESYRSRVLQAGLAVSQGMATLLKTALGRVSGVQTRLVSVRQLANDAGWEVLVGGGDPYEVAYAIFTSLFDVTSLRSSTLSVTNITKANPGVVTTDLNHNYATGQEVEMNEVVGMTQVNGVNYTITVITEKSFSLGVNTSGFTTYVSGGVVTPNLRNEEVTIDDYPDSYLVPFVRPPSQTVAVTATWNTSSANFVSQASVAQLAGPAIAAYINDIAVGQPINEFEMTTVFQAAVASILAPQLITRLVFDVSINGIGTPVEAGTGIVEGDPESYFETTDGDITVTQG